MKPSSAGAGCLAAAAGVALAAADWAGCLFRKSPMSRSGRSRGAAVTEEEAATAHSTSSRKAHPLVKPEPQWQSSTSTPSPVLTGHILDKLHRTYRPPAAATCVPVPPVPIPAPAVALPRAAPLGPAATLRQQTKCHSRRALLSQIWSLDLTAAVAAAADSDASGGGIDKHALQACIVD